MENDDQDKAGNFIGWLVVHGGVGLALAGMMTLAVHRFGALSIGAIFLSGWIGHAIFTEILNAISAQDR